ncbi:tetratricopeptide repeat protein [Undibacterium sp.]|uniref:tetratricopeptide repeat protein n=1 Tax=Undibacterium sp. TaxID=1914977 RepID=UPI0025D16583|nr:tetratricopeptide repeat protein [Undibacterium sp.]MCX7219248.1 tetratricopeptide repeat protein [Burkholderiales bacterium]
MALGIMLGFKNSSLHRSKVLCLHCHSANIRRSKWLSQTEKNTHPKSAPYRCLDCSKRFIGSTDFSHLSQKSLIITRILLAASLLVGLLILMFVIIGNSSSSLSSQSSAAFLNNAENNSARMKAAEKGDAQAQFELGQSLLQNMEGNPEDTAMGVLWLRKAASNGNSSAMVALGRLAKNGVGVLQSYAQALEWMQAAANKGNPEGMLELGRLYRDGVAVPKDTVLAYIWLNRSAALHNRSAAQERDLIANGLNADKLKEAQSLSVSASKAKPQ